MEDKSPASTLLATAHCGSFGTLTLWYVAGYKHPFRIELYFGGNVKTVATASSKISGLAKFLAKVPVGGTIFDNSRD